MRLDAQTLQDAPCDIIRAVLFLQSADVEAGRMKKGLAVLIHHQPHYPLVTEIKAI